MRNLELAMMILFLFLGVSIFGQGQKRDTSLFNEHQVVFEKMDYILTKQQVYIKRILNNDTVSNHAASDPFWISSLLTNKEYQDYLNSIKKDSTSPIYHNGLITEDLLIQTIPGLNINLDKYFSDSKYDNYPVLGITWNQANSYCKWKTTQVNIELSMANLPHEKSYRLPYQVEFEMARKIINIDAPKISKIDTIGDYTGLTNFNLTINEWTKESFFADRYLKELVLDENSDEAIIYEKTGFSNKPYRKKDERFVNIGFRYVQTYRKVKNSE
jgi:hypothetical protein